MRNERILEKDDLAWLVLAATKIEEFALDERMFLMDLVLTALGVPVNISPIHVKGDLYVGDEFSRDYWYYKIDEVKGIRQARKFIKDTIEEVRFQSWELT